MLVRKATAKDIDVLVQLRQDFLTEEGFSMASPEGDAVVAQLKRYFAEHIGRDFIAVLAEEEGVILSSAYLSVCERPASPAFVTGRVGVLLNVFTYPSYRRRGIATKVLKKIIEEAALLEVSLIDLFATEQGRGLYLKMGFMVQSEAAMRLTLQKNRNL